MAEPLFIPVDPVPRREEEYPEQPLWRSVLQFCCKGMIEGIIVLLFVWLLVQILFTKHLEVHLQVLLGVGLALFCLSLILGCVLSLCRGSPPPRDKEAAAIPPTPTPGDHVNLALSSSSPSDSAAGTPIKQQYEELDGDTLEQPCSLSCSTPSDGDSVDHSFIVARPRATSERIGERPGSSSFFPLRRLGSSVASLSLSSRRAACLPTRSSLSSLPRLGLLSKTRRALERRCTVTGDSLLLQSDRSGLSSPTLSTASTDSVFQPQALSEELYFRHCGSGCGSGSGHCGSGCGSGSGHCGSPGHCGSGCGSGSGHCGSGCGSGSGHCGSARCGSGHCGSGCGSSGGRQPPPLQLRFSLLFSRARGTLTVNVLGVSRLSAVCPGGVSVHAALPPLCPTPMKLSIRRCSLSHELQSQSFTLPVGSAEELRRCTLRMSVLTRDLSGLKEEPLGELELLCSELEWEPNHTIHCSKELSPSISRVKKIKIFDQVFEMKIDSDRHEGQVNRYKSSSSPDPPGPRLLVGPQKPVGQLYILLQYQGLAHRIKVTVQRAENLAMLSPIRGVQDHYVVINLHHEGRVIGTEETKGTGGYNAVWNTPFLFDLPPGDVTQLPLVLEFIVMQGRALVKSSELGRVLIGCVALEAGQAHWRDMCHREQVETARWHAIQPTP